jgi:hypothetical protein
MFVAKIMYLASGKTQDCYMYLFDSQGRLIQNAFCYSNLK